MRHGGQVHNLLGVGLGEHGEAGLAGGVNVAVVAEDVQRLGGDGTGRNVKDAGQAFGCDLVHVGDHQQKTLGGGEGGGDGAGAQRTVHRAGSAGLGLHLNNLDLVAEDVLQPRRAPLVDGVGHRARRGDGVDSSHIGKRICHMRRRGIAIHRLFGSWHFSSSVYMRRTAGRNRPAPGIQHPHTPKEAPARPGGESLALHPFVYRNPFFRRGARLAGADRPAYKRCLLVVILPNRKAFRKVGLHRMLHEFLVENLSFCRFPCGVRQDCPQGSCRNPPDFV